RCWPFNLFGGRLKEARAIAELADSGSNPDKGDPRRRSAAFPPVGQGLLRAGSQAQVSSSAPASLSVRRSHGRTPPERRASGRATAVRLSWVRAPINGNGRKTTPG